MGFRFQKSIKLGGGFRLNLSKSGVGFSAGRRGARIGIDSRGRGYANLGIPGAGLSTRIYASGPKKRGGGQNPQALLQQQPPVLLARIPSQQECIWSYQKWRRNHPKRVTLEDARFSHISNASGKNLRLLGAARRISRSDPGISVTQALNRAAIEVANRQYVNLLSIQCCARNQFNTFPNLPSLLSQWFVT